MDSLESVDPLDGPDGCRHPHRRWNAHHLHALFQLPGRRLSSDVGHTCMLKIIPPRMIEADLMIISAASAVAANIMLRSVIAAGFPLFTRQMFANLGIQWAGTLLGCLATVMIPIPIVFWFYGAALRQKSKVMAVAAV
jgi:hypothetical protein